MRCCNQCGDELIEGVNWSPGAVRNWTYRCKACWPPKATTAPAKSDALFAHDMTRHNLETCGDRRAAELKQAKQRIEAQLQQPDIQASLSKPYRSVIKTVRLW